MKTKLNLLATLLVSLMFATLTFVIINILWKGEKKWTLSIIEGLVLTIIFSYFNPNVKKLIREIKDEQETQK